MAWLKTVEENNKKKEEKIRQYKANKNLIYNKIYNTRRWQKLRQSYLIDQPLCEECLKKKGKIVPALTVHHIIPISTAGNDVDKMVELGFNYHNLEALCEECHKKKHNKTDYFLFENEPNN